MNIHFRKRDISTSLFLQLRIFTCVSFSLKELKEEVNEAIFLNGGGVHGLFHNLSHFIAKLIDGVKIISINFPQYYCNDLC